MLSKFGTRNVYFLNRSELRMTRSIPIQICSYAALLYVIQSTLSYMLNYDSSQHIGNLEYEVLVLLKSQSICATASNRVCLWASLGYISAGILLQGMDCR